MKKRSWMLLMIVTIVFAFSTNGYSLHLITVTINPTLDPLYSNNNTGTFSALVTVTNYSNLSLQYFQLQSINAAQLSFNSTSGIPGGWYSAFPSTGSGQLLSIWGPALTPGSSFSFYMNYTLFTPASNVTWGSGGLWSMNGVAAGEYPDGGFGFTGFSSTVIPEPGTVILLGFGLLGTGFFARRRKKRDS